MHVYSVYDAKAEAFLQPFFAKTRGLAMRSFIDACTRPDHDFSLHSGDYALYELGEFDDVSGRFENVSGVPLEIMSGRDAVQQRKSEG